jgi:hypothetical protein
LRQRAAGRRPSGVDAGFPAVPALGQFPDHPSGIHPHDRSLQGRSGPARGRRLEARPSPLAQSQRLARRFNRHSHLATAHPPAPIPRQTPLSGSHLVGAHPPCSRKGPLLPACGLKCPWRVKREATNSRFLWTLGTLPNFSVLKPTPCCQSTPVQPCPGRPQGPSSAGRCGIHPASEERPVRAGSRLCSW